MIELQSTWGGLAALYLFLGGLSAGAFLVLAVLRFVFPGKLARVQMIGAWASAACLAAGLGCLVVEVEKPLQAMLLPLSFTNFASVMTVGAWLLLLAFVVFVVYALLSTPKVAGRFSADKVLFALRALAIAGGALAVGVAVYTGVLLSAAGSIPLWDTPLLPALFAVSAFDTGVALVAIVCALRMRKDAASRADAVVEAEVGAQIEVEAEVDGAAPAPRSVSRAPEDAALGLLGKFAMALVVAEACVLAAFLIDGVARGVGSAAAMVDGQLAMAFWLVVVVIGLAVPFAVAVASFVLKRKGAAVPLRANLVLAEGACVLVGGLALRALVLFAGVHAALASPLALQAAQGISFIVG